MDETDYAFCSVIYGLKRLVVVLKKLYFPLGLGERFYKLYI